MLRHCVIIRTSEIAFPILLWMMLGGYAFSETLVLQEGINGYAGTKDNSLYADRPSNSNGASPYLYAGATGESLRRALIQFDLNEIPTGSSVTNVSLQLTVNQAGPPAVDQDVYRLHRLNKDWGEGSVVAPEPGGFGEAAQAGNATWIDNFFQQSQWDSPGGDFVAESSSQTATSRNRGDTVTFSSERMAQDVQAWLDNPNTNFGWILIGEEEGTRNARRFVSSEGEESQRPQLTIEFTTVVPVATWSLY